MTLPRQYVLIVFFLTLLLGAVVLGPLLYWSLAFAHVPFHRAMDRALLISAIAALSLFRLRIPLRKLWPLDGSAWKQVLLGYALAFVSAQALIGFYLAAVGFTRVHLGWHDATLRVLMAVTAALLIPPIEETVFRGFIQHELGQSLGRRWGWIVAAAIFMLAHFVKIPTELDHQQVHLWSGAKAIGAAFLPLVHGDFISGRGMNLFLLGLILGGIFLRSGSLWLNAGLHGGLILTLLVFTGLTRPSEHPRIEFLGGDLLASPLTTVVLLLLGLWLWWFYRPHSNAPATGENAP